MTDCFSNICFQILIFDKYLNWPYPNIVISEDNIISYIFMYILILINLTGLCCHYHMSCRILFIGKCLLSLIGEQDYLYIMIEIHKTVQIWDDWKLMVIRSYSNLNCICVEICFVNIYVPYYLPLFVWYNRY